MTKTNEVEEAEGGWGGAAASEAAGGCLSSLESRGRKWRAIRLVHATNGQTGVGDGSDSRSASPPGVWLEGRNGSVHSLGEKRKKKKSGEVFKPSKRGET